MIVTNHVVTIAALLANDTTLVGQCEISHPVGEVTARVSFEDAAEGEEEIAVQTRNAVFTKDESGHDALPAPISSWVVLSYAFNRCLICFAFLQSYSTSTHMVKASLPWLCHDTTLKNATETRPKPNPAFLSKIKESELLIYSCGSLWTRQVNRSFAQ